MMYQLIKQDVDYLGYPIKYPHSPSTKIEEPDIEYMRGTLLSKWLLKRFKESFYHSVVNPIEIDFSSIQPHFEIKTETSLIKELTTASEEDIVMEMIDHDFVVKMPPKNKYKINVIVRSIQKGKPRVVEPEEFLF